MSEQTYSPKILTALNAVMAACGYVRKKGENKFHGYKYAGEGNLLEVLRPAMVEHGLILIPSHSGKSEIDQFGNLFVTVEYTLAHKDGDVWPEKIIAFGSGNDKNKSGGVGDKGLYKALTGANKYLLFKLFQIETGDDPERESDHDKDGAPANVNAPAPKSNPGVSKAKEWLNKQRPEIFSCEDPDQFVAYLSSIYDTAVRLVREHPYLWVGEEESQGLRGMVEQRAAQIKSAREAKDWVERVQTAAKQPQQKAA